MEFQTPVYDPACGEQGQVIFSLGTAAGNLSRQSRDRVEAGPHLGSCFDGLMHVLIISVAA